MSIQIHNNVSGFVGKSILGILIKGAPDTTLRFAFLKPNDNGHPKIKIMVQKSTFQCCLLEIQS